ncbi:MAG: hypothetical protein Q9225_005377 [Loekoesia sp. 1 TL-2023]
MSFTQMIMSPTVPYQSSLESIGSVAANFARTKEDEQQAEYLRFAYESPESEHLLRTYGQAVHDDYLAQMRVNHDRAQAEEAKRLEKKAKRHCRRRERCLRVGKELRDILRSLNCFSI